MKNSPAQLEQLAKSLAREVSGDVHFAPYDRALYSTDASMYQIQPLGVVLPRSVHDVVCTVQWAAEQQIAIIPRGSGTSLSGQSIGAGIVIDFSKYLNHIVELDPEACVARIEPGVVLDQLNQAAAPFRLQFGPDVATSSRANLGGMIGNNSAGSRSILYGKTVDHVWSLEVVLSDGSTATFEPVCPEEQSRRSSGATREAEIYRAIERIVAENREEIIARFPPLVRRVSGYNLDEFVPECMQRLNRPPIAALVRQIERDRYPGAELNLAKLLVGAEGTLGCVTGARVQLVPTPHARGIAVLEFSSLAAAVGAIDRLLEGRPSAVELFDRMILDLAAHSLEYRNYLDFVVGQPESLVLVEYSAETAGEVEEQLSLLRERLAQCQGLDHVTTTQEAQLAAHIWACRKAALPLLMGIPGNRKPIAFVEDSAVAPERLPEFVARFRSILSKAGTDGAFYGHASVGVLHIRPLIDTRSREDLARMQQILTEVSDLVLEFGGAMSGEHGDGLARSYLNEKLFGPRVYQAFREVKQAFDPLNLMNPGKIVDGPSPIENLRHGPGERPLEIVTTFDFSKQGGLSGAAALCNGSGVCRKTQTGTMCPSFMATGDEEHSTRGRANALRLVLSGVVPHSELAGQNLYDTFDLCLQCKGCKAECPSNVDVAKLKAEFLHQYHKVHGIPRGDWIMAHVGTLNRIGSALAPVSNWMGRLPFAGWVAEKLLGIDRRRPLPRFERLNFRKWFARRGGRPAEGGRGEVLLLDDCLTSFCEPNVNRAAVGVLEAAGYTVRLAGVSCCGRAMISKGMLDDAKKLAQENIERLLPWARKGIAIVGCEPSCLLTLTDDYLDLVGGEDAQTVASQASLIDSLLVERGVSLPLIPGPGELLMHGHCHQKALLGLDHARRALAMVPEARVTTVDSGCCGMAGSFGYEHYDLSMRIGEQVLFPAVRRHPGAIVAPGFSCRHQIEHGTGRKALHPIEVLAAQLKG